MALIMGMGGTWLGGRGGGGGSRGTRNPEVKTLNPRGEEVGKPMIYPPMKLLCMLLSEPANVRSARRSPEAGAGFPKPLFPR